MVMPFHLGLMIATEGKNNREQKSHVGVVGTIAALWGFPCDITCWVFNIAGFTMHAILCVDLKLGITAILGTDDFIYSCGAVPLRGLAV